MFQINKNLAILAVVAGLAMSQAALATTMNFDSLAAGSDANMDAGAVALGVTFHNAAFLPSLDSFGDPIKGSDHWQIDTSVADLVTVDNTILNGYGDAPSGLNALDARWSPIMMDFAAITDIASFSAMLPKTTLGNLGLSDILFLDAAGQTLYDLQYHQGQKLATISTPATINGVKDIILASGTFYDNINVTPVPEPSTLIMFGYGLLGLVGLRRAKKI